MSQPRRVDAHRDSDAYRRRPRLYDLVDRRTHSIEHERDTETRKFHTVRVHGHCWLTDGGTPEDTRGLGPAESFRVRWRENAPATWLYHCHVETHMAQGMIGLYKVRP